MATGRFRLASLDARVRAAAEWCLLVADYYGVPVDVTSGYRSMDEQRRLYDAYVSCLNTPGCTPQYPANRPGDSAHNWRLAWDSVVDPRYQNWWDSVRRYAGFEVLSNDLIHAQVPNWREIVGIRG